MYEHLAKKLTVIGDTNLDKFFVECVIRGFNDFSSPYMTNQAKDVAAKYNLPTDNVHELYKLAYRIHYPLWEARRRKKRAAQVAQERENWKRLTKYSDKFGREKRIAMLTEQIRSLKSAADTLTKGAQYLANAPEKKEWNAYSWGGFANALAGPGAGLATALQTEMENLAIRAQNARQREALKPVITDALRVAAKQQALAAEAEALIVKAERAMIEEGDSKDIYSKLSVRRTEITISDTGACTMTIGVKTKEPLKVKGKEAVVDGTIIADVFEDGEKVAEITFVLPLQGADTSGVSVSGMCLSGVHRDKKQVVRYKPGKLWIIES